MQKKSFNTPDKTNTFPKTKVDVVKIGDRVLLRNTFEAGWKWSEHVKPAAGTNSCMTHHVLYMISGRLKAVLDDGTELEIGPGEVGDIPAGHDAWVVGDEPALSIDVASGAQ